MTGTPAEVAEQVRGLRRGRSVLDTVAGEAKKLDRTLGPQDRQKLDEYSTAVRGLEGRLTEYEAWAARPKPKVDAAPPTDVADRADAVGRARLMYEIDRPGPADRLDPGGDAPARRHRHRCRRCRGVTHDWHGLSHHGQDPAKIDELKRIELAEFGAFAEFLGRLKGVTEDGPRSSTGRPCCSARTSGTPARTTGGTSRWWSPAAGSGTASTWRSTGRTTPRSRTCSSPSPGGRGSNSTASGAARRPA